MINVKLPNLSIDSNKISFSEKAQINGKTSSVDFTSLINNKDIYLNSDDNILNNENKDLDLGKILNTIYNLTEDITNILQEDTATEDGALDEINQLLGQINFFYNFLNNKEIKITDFHDIQNDMGSNGDFLINQPMNSNYYEKDILSQLLNSQTPIIKNSPQQIISNVKDVKNVVGETDKINIVEPLQQIMSNAKDINNVEDKTDNVNIVESLQQIMSNVKYVNNVKSEADNANTVEPLQQIIPEVKDVKNVEGEVDNVTIVDQLKPIMPNVKDSEAHQSLYNNSNRTSVSYELENVKLNINQVDRKSKTKEITSELGKVLQQIEWKEIQSFDHNITSTKDIPNQINGDSRILLNGADIKELMVKIEENLENVESKLINILPQDKDTVIKLIPDFLQIKYKINSVENTQKTIDSKVEIKNLFSQKKSEIKHLENDTSDFVEIKENSILTKIVENSEDKNYSKIKRISEFMPHLNHVDSFKGESVTPNIENIVVNREAMIEDVIKAVKIMELNNIKELTVKVMPKELGELVIKLTEESGVMKAHIQATNKETYNTLNAHFTDLNNTLNNTDIRIESVTVSIYNGDTTFFKDGNSSGGNGQSNTKQRKNTETLQEEITIDNITDVNNNLNILA